MYKMATPQIAASIKNYKIGKKGGRPVKNETPKREVSNAEIANFISDYQTYKNSEYEFSDEDIELVRKTLSKLKEYDRDYWIKIFKTTKIGFEIEGKIVPCQLKKILSDHNKIHSGEIKFAPDYAEIEKQKEERKKEKDQLQAEEQAITDNDINTREIEYNSIHDVKSAISFLNKHVTKNFKARQMSSDYKELKAIYPITLDEKGVYVCQKE